MSDCRALWKAGRVRALAEVTASRSSTERTQQMTASSRHSLPSEGRTGRAKARKGRPWLTDCVFACNFDLPDVLSDRSLLCSARRGDEASVYDRAGPTGLLCSAVFHLTAGTGKDTRSYEGRAVTFATAMLREDPVRACFLPLVDQIVIGSLPMTGIEGSTFELNIRHVVAICPGGIANALLSLIGV